jgi:hypothetical protein
MLMAEIVVQLHVVAAHMGVQLETVDLAAVAEVRVRVEGLHLAVLAEP